MNPKNTILEKHFEFSNDSYNKRPEFKIKFEIYKSYGEKVSIYKRTKDTIPQMGLSSLTTRDCWSVRWHHSKKECFHTRYFTTLKASKNYVNELITPLQS